jgi:hypothetical protein
MAAIISALEPQEGLRFGKMAAAMVRRGIPVTIVAAKGKNPLPFAWQLNATTDPNVLLGWIQKYGNNCNCGSVATPETVWMFDADTPGSVEVIEKETGHKLPKTFTVSSRPGRFHFYWKQTNASRAMGNRGLHSADKSKPLPLEFDAQQNRRQVISPGSTHPLGFIYTVVDDSPIVEAPDWFCEWVTAKGKLEKAKPTAGKFDLKTVPSFEAVNYWEHYEIEVEDDYGSNWYVTPACPYCGHEHEHSKRTAFYWDGVHFGFHCFAAGCGYPTIGELTRKLNESYEPFPDEIWPGYKQPLLNDPRWNLEVDEVQLEEDKLTPVSAPLSCEEMMEILGGHVIEEKSNVLTMPEPTPEPTQVANPTQVAKPVTYEDYDMDFSNLDTRESYIPVEFPRIESKNDGMFPFPVDAMYGKLKDIAYGLNCPYGFSYPSLLTTACGLDIKDRANNTRATLYCANLGGYNFGKSIVTDRAMASFSTPEGTYEDGTPSSDRGLIGMVGEDIGKRTVFVQDEFRTLMSKCAILNSALTPVLCTLWSKDHAKAADKRSTDECWGVVSMVGNLAVEDPGDFAKVMGAETTRGLYDRMLFGIGPVVDFYPCNVKRHQIDVKPCLVPGWCYTKMHEWIQDDRARRRLGEIGLRVALIQSAVNGDAEVTQESFGCAFKLMDWQYSIRMVYRAGKAESKEAEAFEAVAGALQAQLDKQMKTGDAPKGAIRDEVMEKLIPDYCVKQLHWSSIMNNKSLYRKHGSPLLNRIKQSMLHENIIAAVYDKDENGEDSREPSPFVVLRGRIK